MTNYVSTHELKTGDIVEHYGCMFELTERFNRKDKDDLVYDEQGVTWFKTKCLEYAEGPIPKHWADTWTIQGNKNATWRVVEG